MGILAGVFGALLDAYHKRADRKHQEKLAELEAKKNAAKDMAMWERLMAIASQNSWKDEAWTVWILGFLTVIFIWGEHPRVQAGVQNIENLPDMVQWLVVACASAAFGIKGIKLFNKNGRK